MKRNVYIDCDGVIFDSEIQAFKEMHEKNIKKDLEITTYFRNADWSFLFQSGGILNDAVNKIQDLSESNMFLELYVLTHVCSFREAVFKTETFDYLLPNVTTITIPKDISKDEVEGIQVSNNILVDDSNKKVIRWLSKGGIGVLFNRYADRLIKPFEFGLNQPYYIIGDLSQIKVINELESKFSKTYKKSINYFL